MNEETEPQRIVRVLAYALRHQPLRFGVALDEEGFADLDELVVLGSPGERRSPPEFLLHGTPSGTVASVLATGLRSMNRAFVHLTSDPDYAAQVAAAKGGGVVLRVRAKAAADDGVEFLLANPHVWLVRHVPAAYLGSDGPNDVARRPRNSARGVVG